MRIAKIIGHVTLSRCHPSFVGASLRLAAPYTLADLAENREPSVEPLVTWDAFGAGLGNLIALAEGPEASQPFRPHDKAVDAYAAAILDAVRVENPFK